MAVGNGNVNFPISHSIQELNDFRVVHPSIVSRSQRLESHTDFCVISAEEWPDRSKKHAMRLWIQRKKHYMRRHWRVVIAIGILIVVLIILFVIAALLLTLLPKKNSSIKSNNFTPGFENGTLTTVSPSDSPHHLGFVMFIL